MAFHWDERKRLRNIAKHGFDFLLANELFEGPHVIVPSPSRPAGGTLSGGRQGGRQWATVVDTLSGWPPPDHLDEERTRCGKTKSIRSYAAEDLKAMRRRGEDRTDWAKVDAMTEADLERAIAEDEDERDFEPDWTRAELVLPGLGSRSICGSSPRWSIFSRTAARVTSPACKPSCAPTSTPRNAAVGRRATDLLARLATPILLLPRHAQAPRRRPG